MLDFCQSFKLSLCILPRMNLYHMVLKYKYYWPQFSSLRCPNLIASCFLRFFFSGTKLAFKDREKLTPLESFLWHRSSRKYVDNLGSAGTEWEKVFRQCFVRHTSILDRVSYVCIVVITFSVIRYLSLEAVVTTIKYRGNLTQCIIRYFRSF